MNLTQEQIRKIQEEHLVDQSITDAVLLKVKPSWKMTHKEPDGAAFIRGTMQVIISVSEYDGKPWIHVSACGRLGQKEFYLPSYEEFKRVKQDFLGDVWAYQVFPPESEHVNIHKYVLHLFSPLDGLPALPDFTRGLGMI